MDYGPMDHGYRDDRAILYQRPPYVDPSPSSSQNSADEKLDTIVDPGATPNQLKDNTQLTGSDRNGQPVVELDIIVNSVEDMNLEQQVQLIWNNDIPWILSKLCGLESTKHFNAKSCIVNPSKSFKESQDSSSDLLAERKIVEVVKDVCNIHNDLCDTCLLAEEYFALKMLTIVGIGFLIIVFNLYYVMEIAFNETPAEFQDESYKFLIFLIFQVAMNILGILCIIQSSVAISNENDKCSIYVHKLMNTTSDEHLKQKLLEFSLQLIHRKVKFTALNLFPLDRTLIFTIAGAATTFLIILFQFSNQANRWAPTERNMIENLWGTTIAVE